MSDERELPDGWSVAGYEGSDGWVDTEKGGELPSDSDLIYSYQTVVVFDDGEGNKNYYTIMGGVDEWEGLEDAIDDLMEEYG